MKLINQINDESCVHACLAMVTGADVGVLWARYPFPLTPKQELTVLIEGRAWPVAQPPFDNQFPLCGTYLVSVPSLNVPGVLHRLVVLVGQTEVICLDPQRGRDGRQFYSADSFSMSSQTPVKSYCEVVRICMDMLDDLRVVGPAND